MRYAVQCSAIGVDIDLEGDTFHWFVCGQTRLLQGEAVSVSRCGAAAVGAAVSGKEQRGSNAPVLGTSAM